MDAAAPQHALSKADALVSHPISPAQTRDLSGELGAQLSTLNVRAMGFTPLGSGGASGSSAASQPPHSADAASDPAAGSDSEPLTPVAVREALAAVHSLAVTAGVVGHDRDHGAGSACKASPPSPITVLSSSPTAASAAENGSKLSAAAKEWVPPTCGAPVPAAAAVSGGGEQWYPGAWVPDGMYAGEGYDYSSWQEYDPAVASGAQYAAAAGQWGETGAGGSSTAAYADQEGQAYEEQGYNAEEFFETSAYNYQVAAAYYPAKETEEAAAAVLAMAFPSYSAAALRKVLRKANVDIAAAAKELSQMEIEHAAQQKATAAARKPKVAGPPAPVLDESNFPTLGAAAFGPAAAAAPSWAGSSQVKESVKAAPTSEGAAGVAKAGGSTSSPMPSAEGSTGRRGGAKSAAAAVPWVPTGEAVSDQYSATRQEARDHARVRNAYFQQATQAFLAGNKALAKELGAQGRAANEAMKKAHKSAADRIFVQRNGGAGLQGGALQAHNGEPMIDLHGQHAAEGVAVLRRELARLRDAPAGGATKRSVYICVGTGSHTKGANTPARLPAAVECFLSEKGISYSEPQRGLLHIHL